MSEGIDFTIKFNDLMSGPMKDIQKNLQQLNSTLKMTNDLLGNTEKSSKGAAQGTKEMSSFMGELNGELFGTVTAASLAADAIEKIIDTAAEAAKAVFEFGAKSLESGYQARVAFQALAGSVEAGNAHFEEAERFAVDLALPIDKVTSAFLGLREAGIREEWLRPLVATAATLHLLKPDASVEQITALLERIGARGGVTGRDLSAITQLGIPPAALESNRTYIELRKEIEKHPIDKYTAFAGITKIVQEIAHIQHPDTALFKSSQSIEGSIQSIRNEFYMMFNSIDDGASGPMAELRHSFQQLVALFDPRTNSGKEFEQVLAGVVSDVTKLIKYLIANPTVIKDVFAEALVTVKALAGVLEETINLLRIFKAAGNVATFGILPAVGSILNGNDVGASLNYGGNSAFSDAKALVGALGAPRPFADGGVVNSPTFAMVGEAGPEAIVPLNGSGLGGGGMNVSAPITVTVEAGHLDEPLNEQILIEKLAEMLPGALISPLEKIAATSGAM